MAGIGDYVHFHAINYDIYGISRIGNPSISAENALINSHEKLKRLVQQQAQGKKVKTDEISTFLTQFVYPPNDGNYDWSSINSMNQQLFEASKQELQRALDEKYSGFEVLLNNLSLKGYGSEVDKLMAQLQKYQGVGVQKQGAIRRSNLESLINNTLKNVQTGLEELKKQVQAQRLPVKEINAKITDLKHLGNKLSAGLQKYNNENRGLVYFRYNQGQGNLNPLGRALQELNKFAKVNLTPTKKDFGDLAEMAFAYALSVAGRKIDATVDDLTYKTLVEKTGAVTGGQRSKTFVQGFSQYVDLELVNAEINEIMLNNAKANNADTKKLHAPYKIEKNGTVLQSINETQDTVDISVTLENDEFLETENNKIKQLNASIKNVANLKAGVHVLGGSPLLNVLQLGTPDFINHYLNILALQANSITAKNNLKDYQTEVKYMSGVRALSGIRGMDTGGIKYSDAIIINDRASKHVYVWETNDLLDQLDKLQKISEVIQIESGGLPSSLNNQWKGNKKYSTESAIGRISYLIAQLHQYKLFVTLKLNQLIK